MASKRKRNDSFEYVIKRKHTLPKPLYLTFKNEAEGDAYVARLEKLIDAGFVPDEFKQRQVEHLTLRNIITDYLANNTVSKSDVPLLNVLIERLRHVKQSEINYEWSESWIAEMKANNLNPVTIRHYVGSLARCLDWAQKRGVLVNPLRSLPKRYATHQNSEETPRSRRLTSEEEAAVRRGLQKQEVELLILFEIALESAMRLREIYTLRKTQVNMKLRTIYLDKTKNGDKRQVPLSSVLMKILIPYLDTVDEHLFPTYYTGSQDLSKVTALLSKKFQRIFKAAGVEDFRFHDLRHEATSRLFEKTNMNIIEIASITGHKDPRMLKRYANLRGSDLAKKLW